MTDGRIGVADFIRQLRSDLEDSISEGEGKKIRFEVAELDLELQVTASTDVAAGGKGGGGIKLGIFSWGAEADARAAHASGRVQTVRMKLAAKVASEQEDGTVAYTDDVLLSANPRRDG